MANGIYRGWLPVCLCRMSNYAYFGSYAFISNRLSEHIHGESSAGKNKPLPMWAALVAGGSAGFCYWLSCYPIDVVKNKIQASPDTPVPQYKSMMGAFRSIWAKEGIRGFFVGFSPCVVRAFPANAAAFMGFEMAMRLLPE
jgi:solute carrier family 25 (mitochondrial carnitine/acylcarnitine transporter), member 20/29